MKESDLIRKQVEFAKTPFGKRAKIFSVFPMVIAVIFFVAYMFLGNSEDTIVPNLYLIGFGFALLGTCIAQLLYGIMLNNYINNK